jgi:hypothetical protein
MELCPGFRNRKDNKTEASLRGDRVHKALETDKIGDLVEEERPMAQMCKDYIDAEIEQEMPRLPDQDLREVTVKIPLHAGISTFGTFDRLLIYGCNGRMYDYKSGYREVTDAENNVQAWAYVIGTFQKYPGLEGIDFTFLVPNRDEILHHRFIRADLPRMILRLNTIIRCAMEIDWSKAVDETKLDPQPELCEYCEYQTTCPAWGRKALVVASRLGKGLPIPNSLVIDPKRPEDIMHMLRLAPLLEAWSKRVRAEALRLNLEEGLEIPGFKRSSRKTDRAVRSVWGTWEAVKEKVSLKNFLSICAGVSIPELESFFKADAPRNEKAKAAQKMECRLRDAGVWQDQGEIFYLRAVKK